MGWFVQPPDGFVQVPHARDELVGEIAHENGSDTLVFPTQEEAYREARERWDNYRQQVGADAPKVALADDVLELLKNE